MDLSKFTKADKNTTLQELEQEQIAGKPNKKSEEKPIFAYLSSINEIGTITIEFDPPEVFVPKNWREIFVQEHRTNLTLKEQ